MVILESYDRGWRATVDGGRRGGSPPTSSSAGSGWSPAPAWWNSPIARAGLRPGSRCRRCAAASSVWRGAVGAARAAAGATAG